MFLALINFLTFKLLIFILNMWRYLLLFMLMTIHNFWFENQFKLLQSLWDWNSYFYYLLLFWLCILAYKNRPTSTKLLEKMWPSRLISWRLLIPLIRSFLLKFFNDLVLIRIFIGGFILLFKPSCSLFVLMGMFFPYKEDVRQGGPLPLSYFIFLKMCLVDALQSWSIFVSWI